MTPESQRIAIAEACGWYGIHYSGTEGNGPESDVCPPRLVGTLSKCGVGKWGVIYSVPKYVDDLNAMHKAEKMLTDEQDLEYSESLERVVGARFNSNNGEDMRRLRSATAAQRAEAFLKTIGKWEEAQ